MLASLSWWESWLIRSHATWINIREICDNVREVRFDVHETKKTADSLDWKIQRKSDVCVDNADLLAGLERIEKEIKKVRKANGR